MDKKDLFDALDDFSQTLLVTLAEVEAVKKNLKSVVEENIALILSGSAAAVIGLGVIAMSFGIFFALFLVKTFIQYF